MAIEDDIVEDEEGGGREGGREELTFVKKRLMRRRAVARRGSTFVSTQVRIRKATKAWGGPNRASMLSNTPRGGGKP